MHKGRDETCGERAMLIRTQQEAAFPFEFGRLHLRYGKDLARVVRNRLNDRTLSTHERSQWRAVAQQI